MERGIRRALPHAEAFNEAVLKHVEESEDLMRARDTLFILLTATAGAALATVAGEEMLLADLLGRMEIAQKDQGLELAEATWVSLPPAEAIEFFRRKMVMTDVEAKDLAELEDRYSAKGFSVAGLNDRAVLTQMHEELGEAIARGTTKADFVRAMKGTGLNKTRLELIFDTNVLGSYAAGRYAQMTDPDVVKARPFWQYSTAGDGRVRLTHKAMNGRVFRADNPIWDEWYPPNGYRCRCTVFSLSPRDIAREGLTVEEKPPQAVEVDGKVVQVLPDPGFAGSPRLQARADKLVDRIEWDAREKGMLHAPRPAGGGEPGARDEVGDMVRAQDVPRAKKVDAFARTPAARAERQAKDHPFFNVFPGEQLGQVPKGEVWVEVPVYSQNLDTAEQLARRILTRVPEVEDGIEIAGRATYAKGWDTRLWPDPEVVHDASAARRMQLQGAETFARSTEVVFRLRLRGAQHLAEVQDVVLQTEKKQGRPVRQAWKTGDVRVRGEVEQTGAKFLRAWLNHRDFQGGQQVVLSKGGPIPGWQSEPVVVNRRLFAFLPRYPSPKAGKGSL